MTKKKKISDISIITKFMSYVLEHGKKPTSVFSFAKAHNFEEAMFYEHFGSFDDLEQSIFKVFFDNTHDILEKSDEYKSYDNRNKLLSFYYTFFETLTANRSYVVYILDHKKTDLKKLKVLIKLKKSFENYINDLNIDLFNVKQESIEKVQIKTLKETAWFQFMFTLKFWLEDISPSFEKTDILIEKAVNTSFDLIDNKAFKSVVDFGKFLIKQKKR